MKKSLFMLVILILAVHTSVFAGGITCWLNLGPGLGTVDEGSTFLGSLSFQTGKHVFTLRALSTGAAMLDEGKTMTDYSLLYNHCFVDKKIHISAGAGLAYVTGEIDHDGLSLFGGSDDEELGPFIGLPLDVQVFWRPLSFVGLGVYGFACVNSEEFYTGLAFCLQLGKLR